MRHVSCSNMAFFYFVSLTILLFCRWWKNYGFCWNQEKSRFHCNFSLSRKNINHKYSWVSTLFFVLFLMYCFSICSCVYASTVYMWRSEDNFLELVLSFCMSFRDRIQFVRLGDKHLYWLIPSLSFFVFIGTK